ncbi:MAG TPA: type II toxin-antitoxin system PemK/MazF family toxin [Pyrinomonadaceae bacterium]|nr:type II toxin-antitoxin system PemK/MazF family toxin [Pyrinomonadaceae bacterium]
MRTYDRGDVIWIDLDPQSGHEQKDRRPAVVLSPSAYYDRTGLAIVCPITTKAKGYPFEVKIPPGLKVSGVALADHVKNLDLTSKNAAFITKLPASIVEDLFEKLSTLLT